jgi:hypothetical protein
MGVKPGWFDFLLIAPDGRHHWLELKRNVASAKLTEAQAAFMGELIRRGVPFAVCRTFDDAVGVLRDWGALRGLTVML